MFRLGTVEILTIPSSPISTALFTSLLIILQSPLAGLNRTHWMPAGINISSSSLENWNSALLQVARLAFPVRDPKMLRFFQVHHSFEQVQPQANVVFSFILGDLDELGDDTCVIVITVNTPEKPKRRVLVCGPSLLLYGDFLMSVLRADRGQSTTTTKG